jgi:SAM-dependent methyltransferase
MSWRTALKSALVRTGLGGPAFRLTEWMKARSVRPEPSPDGLPVPPPYLIQVIVGYTSAQWYAESGAMIASSFTALFNEAGIDFANAGRVLDFGCGAGRVARQMPRHTKAQIFGVDYNPALVRWCAQNLQGAYTRNRLHPPLDFPDSHFDAIYALSVFTHLRRETQDEWLAELHRVLKPGGCALITFHDEFQPTRPDVAEKLVAEPFRVENDTLEGSNLMATFQTWAETRDRFSRLFDIAAERRSADAPFQQAAAVLRRRQ